MEAVHVYLHWRSKGEIDATIFGHNCKHEIHVGTAEGFKSVY